MEHSRDPTAPSATPSADGDAPKPSDGSVAAAIADATVRTYKEYLGRGPTKTRTTIRDDVVVVLLEDVMTKAEQTLVAGGEQEVVMHMRRTVQSTMRESLTDSVEGFTGRRVRAFMSDNHTDPDLAVEVFVLEPSS